MAKDVYIRDGKKRVPFLRGMLTQYLTQRGVPFDDAYRIAVSARDAIEGRKEVLKREVIRIIKDLVKKRYGTRYEGDYVFWKTVPDAPIIQVTGKGTKAPFSKGILSRSLQASGLDPSMAYEAAKRMESQLIEQGKDRIARDDLRNLTLKTLREGFGGTYADQYLIWRTFRRLNKPIIILIGGATGVGKTSLGIEIAHRLEISRVVSTDAIRQIMRLMFSPELMPSIHQSSYEAWENLTVPLPDNIDPVIEGFREQAVRVCVGAKAMIERAIEENVSMILDGVHLVPGFIDTTPYEKTAYVVSMMVSMLDRAAYEGRFSTRWEEAPSRPFHKYIANMDSILKVQNYILDMAHQHHVPVIENTDFDRATGISLHLIADYLRKQDEFRRELKVEEEHS